MKKYLVLGCSFLVFGGAAYAATTDSVKDMVHSIIGKQVQADSLNSLSTENLTLKELTTHKNGNDFSTLIHSKYRDDQSVKEHKEIIDTLNKRLQETTFETLLTSFGNEQTGIIPDGDEHTGESFDRIGLEETYTRLQQEGREFFEAFFTAFPGTDQTQIEEHFNELIFVATYLGKWYDVSIGDGSLWELMYFDGAELTTDSQWGIEQLLAFAEELKADNYEALLSKNVGNTFKKTEVYSQFTGKKYSELIEWFVKKETGNTDYTKWFYDYFNGIIKMDTALTADDNVGIWNRNETFKDNLPYLLTQKPGSNLTLIESYRLLMIVSGNDKEEDILNTIRVIKNEESFFYRTYNHKEEVDNSIGQLVLWAPNWNLLDETDDYAKNLLLPSENFSSHNGNGAVGGYQYISLQQNGYDTATVAHELGHSMNGLLGAGGEFLTTYIYNVNRNTGSYINTYADNKNIKYGSDFPINSDVNEIKDKEDLVTMTKNSENFIYAMDAVIADIVLDMPTSEQVKYIRKVPINVDSGTMIEEYVPNASFDAQPVTISELESMNLQGIDDLIDHGLVIMEPDDTNNNILTNHGQGYGTSLTYSSYFLANGKWFDHTHRIINTILSEDGWDGFKRFNVYNASQGDDWNASNMHQRSIDALRSALNDPSVTYRSYVQEKYHENRATLGEKGLKTMSYLDLKNNFENSIDDFYKVKQELYKNYSTLTNSFKEDAFGYDTSTIKEVSSYEELYDVVSANPKATISISQDFSVPKGAQTIGSFEGRLKGNGHTISNGTSALFEKLNNATIESLILQDFMIEDQEIHTGILANQAENTNMLDVHVLNSTASIKQGVKYSVGGLLGEAKNSSISQCSSQGNEITGSYAGGIVGYGENTSITDTYVYGGTMTGNEVGDLRVGGLAGNFISGTIKNTYSSATIKNGHGFIGSTYSYGTPAINEANSFSIGNVDEDRLKFMEDDNNSKTYQNNYELSTASGKSSVGIAKLDVKAIEESTLKETNFYTEQLGWNTENTWQIEKVTNGDLPYLRNSDPRNPAGYQEPVVFEWVTPVNDQSTILEGKVSQKATVTVYDEGTKIGQEETTENGEFSIPIEPLMGNHQLKIVAKTNTIEKEMYLQVQGTAPTIKGKKDLTIPVGEYEFKPEQLLESVSDRYGEDNLTYTVDTSKINFGLPGEYEVVVTATNTIGRSSSIKIPVTLKDYNSIVFQGYMTEERFRMGLQTSNKKIRLVENTEITTQLDSGSGTYIDIHLYDRTGKLKKQASTNAEDVSEVLVKAFDQTPYEEGDLLDISYLQQSNKMQFYQKGEVELPFGNSGKNQLFTIKNDELVRLTDDMIQTKEVTAEVGNSVQAEDFVESVNEAFSEMTVHYGLKEPFNPGKTGEQTNTLEVSLGEALSQEIPVKLNYSYGNNLSIHCYYEEERFILGLNKQSQTLNFVTDISMDTPLDLGSGEYLTITVHDKTGKQKYQLKANAEDSPGQLIQTLNGKAYENGDRITVKHKNSGKIGLYVKGALQLDYGNSQNSEEFIIQNNQLMQYDPEAINVTGQEGETTIGEKLDPKDFIENGQPNYTYTFVQEPNYYQYGEQTVQVKVTDDQGKTAIVETTLVIKHESELTISTKETTDERLTLKIDPATHQLHGITDPKNTEAFSKTSEPEVLVIALYNKDDELRQTITLDGGVAPQGYMNELSKQIVEIGDYLTVTSKENVQQALYHEGTNIQTTNESTSAYQINSQWQFESRKTSTPPDEDEENDSTSATKIDADVLIEFLKDDAPANPVDPDDPSQPVEPVDPPNTIGGDLMITYASVLDFGIQSKSSNEWFAKGDQLKDGQMITPFISIKDTRGTERKGWSLTATMDGQFINTDTGKPLEGAELYYSDLYSGISGDSNAPEVRKGSILIDEQGVELAKATATSGYNQNSIGLGKLQSNGETNGVKLSTPVNSVKDVGKYTTTVTYTLVADPTVGKG